MTHSTTVVDGRSVSGSRYEVVADLNITSLDNADSEGFTPSDEFAEISDAVGVHVIQAENAGSYVYSTEQNNDIHVEAYGGTDPTAGTDVGVVRVRVVGRSKP